MLKAGDKAPPFSLSDLEGRERTLGGLTSGGPALLAFFKITCPTCQYTLPFLERLTAALPVVGISQDDRRGTGEFREQFGLNYTCLIDPKSAGYAVSNAFAIRHVPSLFLVEPDGTIAWASHGFHRGDLERLAERAGAPLFRPDEKVPEWRPG